MDILRRIIPKPKLTNRTHCRIIITKYLRYCLSMLFESNMYVTPFYFPQLQSLIPFQQISPNESIKEDYGLGGVDVPKDLFM